ncbi:MAG: SRPBCC family protein [Halobacteriota archaeon]
MIKFEVSIAIEKPVEEVFGFVAEGENGPKWNSAVKSVRKISEGPVNVGTKYSMIRQLPKGSAENTYEVVEYEENKKISIKIISGPTPFLYRYRFKPSDKGTELSLDAEAEKEGLTEVLGTKARIAPEFVLRGFVKRGVEENLQMLKSLLESNESGASAV